MVTFGNHQESSEVLRIQWKMINYCVVGRYNNDNLPDKVQKGSTLFQHTSTIFHEYENLVNTRAGLIDGATKVFDGILVA